jgi:hypothetical protein
MAMPVKALLVTACGCTQERVLPGPTAPPFYELNILERALAWNALKDVTPETPPKHRRRRFQRYGEFNGMVRYLEVLE